MQGHNSTTSRFTLLFAFLLTLVLALPAEGQILAPASAPPLVLSAVATSVQDIELDWAISATLQPNVTSFRVLRDNTVLATVDAATLTYADTGVAPARRYRYTVEALNGAGKTLATAQSKLTLTPDRPGTTDTTPPTEPEELDVIARSDGILLDWYYSIDDSDVTAFLIRRDGKRLVIVPGGTLRFLDTRVRPGETHTYTIEALDTVGHHSKARGPGAARALAGAPDARAALAALPSAQGDTPQLIAGGYVTQLKRYPYLTDVVLSSATINWATDRSKTAGSVKWGAVGTNGTCTPSTTVTATKTNLTVNSASEYQWSATLSLAPNTQYCYRIYLSSTDLLGTDPSPRFWTQLPAGSTQPFSFAVFGDWGAVDTSGANSEQANLMQRIAGSGARFAITTGDNSYPSGSQNNYGDLTAVGGDLSAVFGPSFWAVPGSSIALFPTIGNHGLARSDTIHPHFQNWPQSVAVSSSGGRYTKDTYCCLNGSASASYPSAWYAFDAGVARFYILQVAWADSNVGTSTDYGMDYAYHWAPGKAEYQWLAADLAAHPGGMKFAFLHYPIYSDKSNTASDTFLQGANRLEGLLSSNGVAIAFSGHSHIYQRNAKASANGLVTYITGGGGAKVEPIGPDGCSAVDLYGIGWSYSANGGAGAGSACGSASKPTSRARVFHFLLVSVNGNQVTVAPTDSNGQTFDVQTYNFGATPPTSTPTNTAVPPTNTPTNIPLTNTPTNTTLPPTDTPTTTPPTNTPTGIPPTNTPTNPPPTNTPTNTAVPPTNTPAPGTIFSDGFESGNLTAWTSSGGLTVQTGVVHSGTYAAQGNTTVGATYAKKTLPSTYTDAYARVYFNILSQASQVNVLRFRTAADGSIAYLYVDTAGKLALRNDAGATTFTSTTIVGSGWHALEFHATISATGATEVWLDGVKIPALSVSTNLGTTAIGRLQIGEVQSGRTYNLLLDDAGFNTAPIGL